MPETGPGSPDVGSPDVGSPDVVGLDAAMSPAAVRPAADAVGETLGDAVGDAATDGGRGWRDHCHPREHCDLTDALDSCDFCDPFDACDLFNNCDPGACDCGSCDVGTCLVAGLLLLLRLAFGLTRTGERAAHCSETPAEYFPPPGTASSSRLALTALRFYKRRVSPHTGATCRFTPSCSSYAAQAVVAHGVRNGARLARQRLRRCRPNGPRGWDPVPSRVRGR